MAKSRPRPSNATGPEAPAVADGPMPADPPPPPLATTDTAILEVRATGARIETISLIFDPIWYRWRYSDVDAAGIDPIQHYFADGHKEGRDPNRFFSTEWYLANNPDVQATGANPFMHYILYGAREGRKPRA